jgi:hypothetical protein
VIAANKKKPLNLGPFSKTADWEVRSVESF